MSVTFLVVDGPKQPDLRDCGCGEGKTPNPRCTDCQGTGRANCGWIYEGEFSLAHSSSIVLLELLEVEGYDWEYGRIPFETFTRLRERIAVLRDTPKLRAEACTAVVVEGPGGGGMRATPEPDSNLVRLERLGPTVITPGRDDAWVRRYLDAIERLINLAEPLSLDVNWG